MENKALGHLITQNGLTSLKAKTLKKHFFVTQKLKKAKKKPIFHISTLKTKLNFASEK